MININVHLETQVSCKCRFKYNKSFKYISDAGTLGFSKSTYSVKQNEGVIAVPVHRLGGMDGKVTTKWRTTEKSAKEGRDFEGGSGTLTFLHNQV